MILSGIEIMEGWTLRSPLLAQLTLCVLLVLFNTGLQFSGSNIAALVTSMLVFVCIVTIILIMLYFMKRRCARKDLKGTVNEHHNVCGTVPSQVTCSQDETAPDSEITTTGNAAYWSFRRSSKDFAAEESDDNDDDDYEVMNSCGESNSEKHVVSLREDGDSENDYEVII